MSHAAATRGEPAPVDLARRVVAEGLGAAMLLCAVVGSGAMASALTRDPALMLLANTLATGAALLAILPMFGAISGAHLNPVVSLGLAATRELSRRDASAYVGAQVAGAIVGVIAANAMFGAETVAWGETARADGARLLAEGIATFGLVGVVRLVGAARPHLTPVAVAAYVTAGYWFTSSSAFANPAATLARAFTDTYAGIRPGDVVPFVVAQLAGAILGWPLFTWLAAPLRR